jgi:DNA-binding beta-propeller fold protein YncE
MVRCINCSLTSIGGPATSARMQYPSRVTLDSVNNLVYIADSGSNVIRVVDLTTNNIINFAGTGTGNTGVSGYSGDGAQATSAKLNAPYAMAVDNANHRVYIADSYNNCVRVVDRNTGIITTFAGGGSTSGLSKF